jgi:hypothetical protein
MIKNLKNELSFPEIGQLRKGAAKTTNMPGVDLGTRFRVVFYPGNDESQKDFIAAFNSLEPESVVATLPFNAIEEVWDTWYEAYTAGRMVARADGERFIRWVDTKTGEVKVNGGAPYTAFTPGMKLGSYTDRNGKEVDITAKPVGRLKLVIPALARMAFLTLMTTSIYDVVNISQQLGALMAITGGRVAGVPLRITRRMREITWVKKDGTATRVKKGLVSVEADPDWVKKMLLHMASNALPGGSEGLLGLPEGNPLTIEGKSSTSQADLERDDDDTWPDGGPDLATHPEPEQPPAPLPPVSPLGDPLVTARNMRTPGGKQLGELTVEQLATMSNTIQRNRAAGKSTTGIDPKQEQPILDAIGVCLGALS